MRKLSVKEHLPPRLKNRVQTPGPTQWEKIVFQKLSSDFHIDHSRTYTQINVRRFVKGHFQRKLFPPGCYARNKSFAILAVRSAWLNPRDLSTVSELGRARDGWSCALLPSNRGLMRYPALAWIPGTGSDPPATCFQC